VPIYEYQCEACGHTVEAFQKMSDDPLTVCEECGGKLRKLMLPVAIHFKGSGFYTTDYGRGSGRATPNRESSESGDAAAADKPARDGKSNGEANSSGAAKDGATPAKEKQKAT
jgi:putative FmdB family regulatory protein